mmetsp:Transcript_91896/g.192154  ORF Transcript_91896/g.192154 Transcript_91896/m.192154 type:complete len:112 (-) Transcript_91896:208-543(-)
MGGVQKQLTLHSGAVVKPVCWWASSACCHQFRSHVLPWGVQFPRPNFCPPCSAQVVERGVVSNIIVHASLVVLIVMAAEVACSALPTSPLSCLVTALCLKIEPLVSLAPLP